MKKEILLLYQESCNRCLARVGIDRSWRTYQKYRVSFNHFKNYLDKCPDDCEMGEKFILEYMRYLSENQGLAASSVVIYLIPLKSILCKAVKRGIITDNPFENIHLTIKCPPRGFLTKDELLQVRSLRIDCIAERQVRDAFVFCCYTGLSFSDVKTLSADMIQVIGNRRWIIRQRKKTEQEYCVRLSTEAERILSDRKTKGGIIFRIGNNSYVNSILSKIMDRCGIIRRITFHCSRHTFATMALNSSVPLESLQKMLGHKNITTTQIYGKITLERLSKDFDKMEKYTIDC